MALIQEEIYNYVKWPILSYEKIAKGYWSAF